MGTDNQRLSRRHATRDRAGFGLIISLILFIGGCDPQQAAGKAPSVGSQMSAEPAPDGIYNLTITGYNYTNTGISSFEVDGQGGGNINVSSPTSGGGGSVCCLIVRAPLRVPQPVTIKWSRDVETWCEQTVLLQPPLPEKPEYFEVHFYEDGHLEVAVTESASSPRLRLERRGPGRRHPNMNMNVINDSKFSRCKIGYR